MIQDTKKTIVNILSIIDNYKFFYRNEKELQKQIEDIFISKKINYQREYSFGELGIVDFFINGVAFEIKIKGSKMAIYRQCKRYTESPEVKALVLISGLSMGFPEEINNKPCYYYRLN